MANGYYVGFDTSNYTTSIAVIDECGTVVSNIKRLLPVPNGQKGLRQSDAVFSHVKAIPEIAIELRAALECVEKGKKKVAAIAFSGTPRSSEGSYMPCFLVGEALASCLASFLDVPLYKVSHQAGHVMAAVYSSLGMNEKTAAEFIKNKFAAFHVSGGTTDILIVEPNDENIFSITRAGGTSDLNAGQVIDRIGVKLGFDFPCGARMDNAALNWNDKIKKDKISVNGLSCNLSGLENKATDMILNNDSVESISAYTLDFISRTLEKLTLNVFDKFGNIPIAYAGGVMSSKFISSRLSKYGKFADAKFSSDNAAGVALLAGEIHKRSKFQ